jgi:DNA polymerase elongation subunit (family B)
MEIHDIIYSERNNVKILLFDLETAPNLAYVWDKYEQDVIAFHTERFLLSVAWKFADEKTVHALGLPDFKGYKKDPNDDKELVKKLHQLFCEADIVVAHNGSKFDVRMANAFFVRHQLPPPSPYKVVDTLLVARRYYRFNSNRLDDLGKYLGLGEKKQTNGFALWKGCLSGDKTSWKKMLEYNKQDVVLLEKVYLTLRPWMTNHPNINALEGKPDACPTCGSKHIQSRGVGCNTTRVYTKFQCLDCRHWFSSLKTVASGVTTK